MPKRGSWTPFETIQRAARGIAVALALKAGATQAAALTVNTTADNTTDDTNLTLREAILLVNNAGNATTALSRPLSANEAAKITGDFGTGDTIRFHPLLFTGGPRVLALNGEELPVSAPATILGPGADKLIVDAQGDSRVFYIYDGTGTAIDVSISGMTLTGGYSAGYGGGIYNSENLTLDGVTISGNSAAGDGGGLWNGGTLTVANGRISGNATDTTGGGIYNATTGVLTITGTEIHSNYAMAHAGAIENPGAAYLDDTLLLDNTTNGDGGAIETRATSVLEITGCVLTGNAAGSDGGAVYGTLATTVTITGSTISGNSAGGNGGAVRTSGAFTITGSTLSGNSATNGGAMNLPGTIPCMISESTLSGNTASTHGGGLRAIAAVTMANATVSGNTAANKGGGIYSKTGLTLSGSLVSGNASSGDGGGVYAGGILYMDGSILQDNQSAAAGGGLSGKPTATLMDSAFLGNSATSVAGGIYGGSPSSFTLDACTVHGNSGASKGGGVMMINFASFEARGCTFSANQATFGGGIYAHGTFQLDDSTVSGNSGGRGGGVWLDNASAGITACTVSGNSVFGYGGGIYNRNLLTLANATLSGNAAYVGGGVFAARTAANSTTTIANTTINGNTSLGGAGIGTKLGAFTAAVSLSNSIVSGSITGADTLPALINFTTSYYNLVEDGSLSGTGILNVDPLLGPLQDNGGPTRTHLPLLGSSPVIDASLYGEATDQRGAPRPQGDSFDLGAVEVVQIDPNDWDGDGITNNLDADDDGDGVKDEKDPDRDGDGVENALDTDPDDPNVAGPAGLVGVPGLSVKKLALKLDFANAGKDAIQASGVFFVPEAFDPTGAAVDVDVGGQAQSFTLDAKGKGVTGTDSFKIKASKKLNPGGSRTAKWTLAMKKGTFAVSDFLGAPLDGSSPGTADRVLKMALRIAGGTPDLRYNAGTVVYKSTAVKGSAKNKKP